MKAWRCGRLWWQYSDDDAHGVGGVVGGGVAVVDGDDHGPHDVAAAAPVYLHTCLLLLLLGLHLLLKLLLSPPACNRHFHEAVCYLVHFQQHPILI